MSRYRSLWTDAYRRRPLFYVAYVVLLIFSLNFVLFHLVEIHNLIGRLGAAVGVPQSDQT